MVVLTLCTPKQVIKQYSGIQDQRVDKKTLFLFSLGQTGLHGPLEVDGGPAQ